MPFLRVIRDKRGYETTYLMHWYREGGRQRSRILYAFRTPGGMRVGRVALDPEIKLELERQHPTIDFDWSAVRDHQQIIDSTPDLRYRRSRREERPSTPATVDRAAAAQPATRPAPSRTPPPAPPSQITLPSRLEGTTADEQIGFLTIWYPRIRERIMLRTLEPSRQEALLALAERLNPAAWTDADQITAGLQQAAEAIDRLAHVFARRRRRGRKGPDSNRTRASSADNPVPPSEP